MTERKDMEYGSLDDMTEAERDELLSTEIFDDCGDYEDALLLEPLEDDEDYPDEEDERAAPAGKSRLYENEQTPQRALLVSVDQGEKDFEESLEELRELTATAGGVVAGVMTQKLSSPVSATCVGSGRLQEIAEFCDLNDIDIVIFDRELSPVQLRNLEKETGKQVIDRTMLILDIFAQRARSVEGKLQVELAQLRYMLPRLTGQGTRLSRLGGGIGTRGPGETKLESDRRHIRRRIEALNDRLSEVAKRRELHRARRRKTGVVTCAIVGYTNAGKSTLLNKLTDAGVLAEDKLFATLDPTLRALSLPSGGSVTLVDTVGFIRRLPHHLIEAFKSTLEEAAQADIILLLCDGADENMRDQLEVSTALLGELGASGKPVITVINKCDKVNPDNLLGISGLRISALTGDGLDGLLEAIEKAMPVAMRKMRLLLPFGELGLAARIRQSGEVTFEEYTADGLLLEAMVDPSLARGLEAYSIDGAEEPQG